MVFDGQIQFLGRLLKPRSRDKSPRPSQTSAGCWNSPFVFRVRSNVAAENKIFRQQRLGVSVFVSLSFLLITQANVTAGEDYLLKPSQATGKFQRVKAALEVRGKLKLNADGSGITKLPIKVKGELLYDERMLVADRGRRKHVRYYHEAQATIQVRQTRKQTRLPEDRRLLVSQQGTQSVTLYSPLGPLTRDALELVDIQGSSAVLDQLLPLERVGIGDSWPNDDATIAVLLGLEAVLQNDTTSTLRKIEGPIVIIKMKGVVSGAVGGVSTDIELDAIYNFDRDLGQVTWLAMSLKEQRAIGHAEPGIDATARLRIALTPIDEPPHLTDAALAGLPLDHHEGSELIEFRSQEGGFRFVHGRGWQVMVDRHDVAILRLIERGDLIAQCNASSLPPLKPGQHLQLAAFQTDVERALGDKFGQFTEASQLTTDSGLRVLRAVVSGVVSELPIHWTYYHISNDKGRQMALVFTLDARLTERFAEADQMLIGSLEFRKPPEPSTAKAGDISSDSLRAAGQPVNSVSR